MCLPGLCSRSAAGLGQKCGRKARCPLPARPAPSLLKRNEAKKEKKRKSNNVELKKLNVLCLLVLRFPCELKRGGGEGFFLRNSAVCAAYRTTSCCRCFDKYRIGWGTQVAKETYYMAKETYYMTKETYFMAKRRNTRQRDVVHVTNIG